MLNSIWFYLIVVPIGVLGIILNGLPFVISDYITYSKAKVPEFVGALKCNIGAFAYLFYVLIILAILFIYCWHLGVIGFFTLLITGLFATYLWERWSYWKAKSHIKRMGKEKLDHLENLRKRISNSI